MKSQAATIGEGVSQQPLCRSSVPGECKLTAFSKRLASVVLYDPRSAVSLSLHALDSRVVPALFGVHPRWRHCRIATAGSASYGARYNHTFYSRAMALVSLGGHGSILRTLTAGRFLRFL